MTHPTNPMPGVSHAGHMTHPTNPMPGVTCRSHDPFPNPMPDVSHAGHMTHPANPMPDVSHAGHMTHPTNPLLAHNPPAAPVEVVGVVVQGHQRSPVIDSGEQQHQTAVKDNEVQDQLGDAKVETLQGGRGTKGEGHHTAS